MDLKLFFFYVVTTSLVLFSSTLSAGPSQSTPPLSHQQQLLKANAFVSSYAYDSAVFYLDTLLAQLATEGTIDQAFGLEVQLATGNTYLAQNRRGKAVLLLNQVRDKSALAEQWTTYVAACLSLAKLFNEIDQLSLAKLFNEVEQQKYTRANLDLAKTALSRYSLAEFYPAYLLEMAAWHENFGYNDSLRYYVQLALTELETLDEPRMKARAYTLMGNSLEEHDYLASVQEHLKTIPLLRGLKDYVSISESWYQITLIYYRNGHLAEALSYNDSSIVACYQALEARREETPILSQAYQIRGRAFNRLGQLDSALYYTRRGFSEEIRLLRRQEQNRIFEISEQYKDEAKTRRIEEQARLLESERLRTRGLIIITGLILLLSTLLGYFYFQVRKSNQVNASQSQLLSITNSELAVSLEHQKMLQAEVHHRVKNNLQVLISLLELQKQDISNEATRSQVEAISGRIYSMAALHDMLHQQDGNQRVSFLAYTKKLCSHLSAASLRSQPIFHYDIPPVHFSLETLMPLGIVLNELLTNSFKYAKRPGKNMEITLQLRPQEDGFQLYYHDNGPGFPAGTLQDRQGGLGAFLLRSMSRQLKGSITTKNDNGATYSIFFQKKASTLQ